MSHICKYVLIKEERNPLHYHHWKQNSMSLPRYVVYLATSGGMFAEGEPDASTLIPTLTEHGIDAKWVIWDDPNVDWGAADLVAVRSTWDYQDKLPDFLLWAARIGNKLLHGERAFQWNTSKSYLLELERAGVPIVPTDYFTSAEDVTRSVETGAGKLVVKPVVGVSGIGVEVVQGGTAGWTPSSPGPWVIQPFLESVKTEGEYAVFLIGGEVTAQMSKKPAKGSILVHEEHGGYHECVELTDEAREVALKGFRAAQSILAMELGYGRADLLRHNDRLVLSEFEITEPQLYFDRIPNHSQLFANVLRRAIAARAAQGKE
jgi:glutathione synthase/RimK-type ligase-like ATP-grasp enzyme